LKPHEDKLAFSAVFVMDDRARLHSRWFGRTVINSSHRYTYETAQSAIDGKAENVSAYSNNLQTVESAHEGMKYRDELAMLGRIAKVLMKDKFLQGAIEFEQEEVKFRLDEQGRPVGIYKKQRLDTHKLVEEYMLLANREVAKFIADTNKKKGFKDSAIYRIHEAPDRDRIKSLAFFVKALGYNLPVKEGVVTARAINDLLDQIEDTPHESLVRTAAIRSMQKAIYSTKNVGHFGLAFKFYTHFTSPIRRYPDLLVHRILARHLADGSFNTIDEASFNDIANRSTSREIDAAEAERASVKYKQVEYMSSHIGETFSGTITGVTKWGMYVEESKTKSEGMVPIRELGNEYFLFDEKTYSIRGEKTGKRFTLGDAVTVKVVSADLDKRTLEYRLV
jgi:ribonuclease R